jgi:high-affinity iron transporter
MIDLSVALQSASILLREGVEAMLVIAALAAFLRRSGAMAELRRSISAPSPPSSPAC